jgi:hypothetical protein
MYETLFHIRFYYASMRTHEAEVIMKGVIVQVGEPKSIVLFNNGKIGAIPTPADCHVGMVVTVKYNNRLKILAITLAAVLLVGAGVFIGVSFVKNKAAEPPITTETTDEETYGWQKGQEKMREVERKFSEH